MADVFISYARSTAKQAQGAAAALRALGYSVWLDDDLAPHRPYTLAIEEQLVSAKAALVIWSADAAKSEWVRSEANRAREDHKLVQLLIDRTRLPMPFDQVQCADLAGWSGEAEHANWRKVVASIGELVRGAAAPSHTPSLPAPGREAPSLPSKPSIAVMPFANMSSDQDQEYFADGMVEEIAAALAQARSLFVIGAGSSLALKGQTLEPQAAARLLGVRYILEGSVRKGGTRVRILVKLIDAQDGAQIWSDRFEGTLEDVFALQDQVASSVAGVIEPAVREAEIRQAAKRPVESLGAYELYLRALPLFRSYAMADVAAAAELLDRAIAQEPDYALAIAFASACHSLMFVFGWGVNPEGEAERSLALARRALRLAGDDPMVMAYAARAFLNQPERDLAAAARLADRALALCPGSCDAILAAGLVKMIGGEHEAAGALAETYLRLDPFSPARFTMMGALGFARFQQRKFAESASLVAEWAQRSDNPAASLVLAAARAHLGDPGGAREALARYRAATPRPVEAMAAALCERPEDRALLLEGIALAAEAEGTAA